MAYMLADWYRPQVVLDYPKGGTGEIANALIRGIEKFGGAIRTSSHVEQIILSGGKAVGVRLRNGDVIRARKAVISNASLWDTLKQVRCFWNANKPHLNVYNEGCSDRRTD
jgi:phytoene dehydrogenase-like protein